MGMGAVRAYLFDQGADLTRHRKETAVKRPAATAVAVAANPSAAYVYRLGVLGFNLGLWTLIVVIARAL